MVPGVEAGGEEGVVGEAVPGGHFVEQARGVAAVERGGGGGAAGVHEEERVGGSERGGDVAGLEERAVQLPAGRGAAGAEELDAAADVGGGHSHDALISRGANRCR